MVKARGLIHGDRVQAFTTKVTYEIDEIDDIEFMEYLVQKNPKYQEILFKG